MNSNNLDKREIAGFSGQAHRWWDKRGPFGALHQINPVRVGYIDGRCGLKGKKVLDVGCGGGLLAEAMAVRGARVTGIDMDPRALATARLHMNLSGLSIDYRRITAEDLSKRQPGAFHVVTCLELLEHVPDPASVMKACSRLIQPGGDLFFATVNRTWAARLLVILAAEYMLGIVPKGTHTYSKFIRPDEMEKWGKKAWLSITDLSGLRYIPFTGYTSLCRNTSMNYLMHFKRRTS